MVSEWGTIEGGRDTGTDEYGSETLYGGDQGYPKELRMKSQEVEDVLKDGNFALDVIRYRTPHCWMPAPEAFQAKITPAYQLDRKVAQDYLRNAGAWRPAIWQAARTAPLALRG